MPNDDKGEKASEDRFFVRSVQPHYLLPDGEVIEYLGTHRDEPDYLTEAIRLRVRKIARSKHSLDVNLGAPMPPPPNILNLNGSLPYMVAQAKKHFEEGQSWMRINNHEKAISCFKLAAVVSPNDDLIQFHLCKSNN